MKKIGGDFEYGEGFRASANQFDCLANGNHALFSSGRNAIYTLLKKLNPNKALLPSYICQSIIDAFEKSNVEIEFYKIKDGIDLIMNGKQNELKKKFLKEILYNRIKFDKAISNNENKIWIDFVSDNMNYLDLPDQINLLMLVATYYKNNKEIEKTFKCLRELLIKDSNKENIVFSEVMHILQ